jgi:Transposase IS66 family
MPVRSVGREGGRRRCSRGVAATLRQRHRRVSRSGTGTGDQIPRNCGRDVRNVGFKYLMAQYYAATLAQLHAKLLAGRVIHADETEVNLKGVGKAYVWVFTNLEEVIYLYKPSREGGFLHEYLKGFSGVLVSDFYTAYDSLPCAQQKCLIHLIRDLNHDILANPFDEELKALAADFGRLLRAAVTTIDRHGLSRRHLGKHKADAERFFETILARTYCSDAAQAYQQRFEKYRVKLFTFLDHDGVPWNNNNAEHAIKGFAYYREIADGLLTESGLKSYLTLLSIQQTCVYKGVSFLKFLVSQEREIDGFCDGGRRGRRVLPYDLYPEGYIPPRRRGRSTKRSPPSMNPLPVAPGP